MRLPECVTRTVEILSNTLHQPLLARVAALVLNLMYYDELLCQALVLNNVISAVTDVLKEQQCQREFK